MCSHSRVREYVVMITCCSHCESHLILLLQIIGKLLNVRDATHAQIMKNEEIMNLVEIMGLKFKTIYTEENIKSLRYGHLMIMADQVRILLSIQLNMQRNRYS